MELAKIDTVGTFRWEVIGTGFGVTKASENSTGGKPQALLDLKALEKWVDDPDGLKHFGLTEPGWVDWSSFNEGTLAYLLLFNSADEFSPNTAMKNYEQLTLALGWDGQEFEAFATGKFDGKKIQARTATNSYKGKDSIQIAWVDKYDANPERSLKSIDTSEIKALTARIRMGKAPVVAASAPTKPASSPAKADVPAATAKPMPPKSSAATSAPPAAATTKPTSAPTFPSEATQTQAWDQLMTVKGDKSDDACADLWLAACTSVANGRSEDAFTPADWASVRDGAIARLAA